MSGGAHGFANQVKKEIEMETDESYRERLEIRFIQWQQAIANTNQRLTSLDWTKVEKFRYSIASLSGDELDLIGKTRLSIGDIVFSESCKRDANRELNAREQKLTEEGNCIQAIKELRDRLYLGLKEAKDIVFAVKEQNDKAKEIKTVSDTKEKEEVYRPDWAIADEEYRKLQRGKEILQSTSIRKVTLAELEPKMVLRRVKKIVGANEAILVYPSDLPFSDAVITLVSEDKSYFDMKRPTYTSSIYNSDFKMYCKQEVLADWYLLLDADGKPTFVL